MEYFNSTIEKIRKEHKFWVMMGDFNLDFASKFEAPWVHSFLTTYFATNQNY